MQLQPSVVIASGSRPARSLAEATACRIGTGRVLPPREAEAVPALDASRIQGLIAGHQRPSVNAMTEFFHIVVLERHSAHRRKRFAG